MFERACREGTPLQVGLVVGVEYNYFLSPVDDEAVAEEVVELRVLFWKPSLELQEVEHEVAVVGIPLRVFLLIVFVVGLNILGARLGHVALALLSETGLCAASVLLEVLVGLEPLPCCGPSLASEPRAAERGSLYLEAE